VQRNISFFNFIKQDCFFLVQERIFKEFYSHTFPSEYMSFESFSEAMDNKLIGKEKTKIQAYFRAFDAQQNSYLTYLDYLLGKSIDIISFFQEI
jgi:Ca2+-binding EF-hand superfamily protein